MEYSPKVLPSCDILLSKKYITGDVDINTPVCVIEEIVSSYNESMNIDRYCNELEYRTMVLSIINEKEPIIVKYPFDEKGISMIVPYINNIQGYIWNISSITNAYYFLDMYSDHNKIGSYEPLPGLDININNCGLMKPNNVKVYTACILYRILKHKSMSFNVTTTLDDMIRYVSLQKQDISYIISTLYNNVSKNDMINMILNSKSGLNDSLDSNEDVYEYLNSLIMKINKETKIINILHLPLTHVEAISLASIYYNCDISYFNNPHRFYIYLNKYKSIDNIFKNINNNYSLPDTYKWLVKCKTLYIRNPNLFSLSTNFNHIFPEKYYDQDALSRMSAMYDHHGGMDYQQMCSLQVINSFHIGWHPNIKGNGTVINQDTISEIDTINVILYGTRCDKLYMFTVDELNEWFVYNKTYKSPIIDINEFSDNEISSLISLSQYQSNQQITPPESNKWIKLISTLTDIKTSLSLANSLILDIIKDNDNIKLYTDILYKLLDLGMYMRGWSGEGPYPSGECYVADYDLDTVEHLVWEKLTEFKKILSSDKGSMISKLPLYTYNLSLEQYEVSNDPNVGLNIGDRINITDRASDTFSCIRIASNYIIPTACLYLDHLKVKYNFDINNMSYIN